MLVANMVALREAETQALWETHKAEHPNRYRYDGYKNNISVAFGLWMDQWFPIVLADDPVIQAQAFWERVDTIRRKVTPIRPGRSSLRTKAPQATAIRINGDGRCSPVSATGPPQAVSEAGLPQDRRLTK